MRRIKKIPAIGLAIMLWMFAGLSVAPILITFTNSMMTEQEISLNYDAIGKLTDDAAGAKDEFANLKLIPDGVSFHQYMQVLILNPKFLQMFWNSAGMVAPIIAGQAVVAALAAYAFAKLRFWGRNGWFLVYIMTMLMPFQVTLVPNYIIVDKLGLMNTTGAIIWPGIFSAFGVFMLRQFMMHVPDALIEAAKMDGAGHFTIFCRIMLPLVKSGLTALTVLLFADYWNMVEQPLIFLEDEFKQPLSLYLAQIGKDARGVGFAASMVYMAPMILLFLYAESYFTQGIQLSGIKG